MGVAMRRTTKAPTMAKQLESICKTTSGAYMASGIGSSYAVEATSTGAMINGASSEREGVSHTAAQCANRRRSLASSEASYSVSAVDESSMLFTGLILAEVISNLQVGMLLCRLNKVRTLIPIIIPSKS